MVSYQTFTAIAFDVADSKGVSFEGIADGGSFVSQLAAFWNQNKEQLIQMTEEQVRRELRDRVQQ